MTAAIAKKIDSSAAEAEDRRVAEAIFDALRAATGDGVGINRQAYGASESAALDLVEGQAQALGLATERDAGANLIITLEGSEPELPFLACGSHLDSVPRGGNFDGAAGVIAGCLFSRVSARKASNRVGLSRLMPCGARKARDSAGPIWAPTRCCGKVSAADLATPANDTGELLARLHARRRRRCRRVEAGKPLLDPKDVHAWLELHIEQGPVLLARELPIGIVTGIRGNVRHRSVECVGEDAMRRGAAPVKARCGVCLGRALTHLDQHWRTLLERGHDLVVTCGVFRHRPTGARDRAHSGQRALFR